MGRHPIIHMQCGPSRFKLSVRSMTTARPFDHEVIPRLTEFCLPPEHIDTTIQELYAAFANDNVRNELIVADLVRAIENGLAPLLRTGRTDHLKYFETALAGKVDIVFVLRGGMGKKQRRSVTEAIAAVPEARQESSWQPGATLERALTMRAWTRCSWHCRFLARARCTMAGASIDCTTRSALSGSTTMSIPNVGSNACTTTERSRCHWL